MYVCKYIFPSTILTKSYFSSFSNCIFKATAENKNNNDDDDGFEGIADTGSDGILQLFVPLQLCAF